MAAPTTTPNHLAERITANASSSRPPSELTARKRISSTAAW
jgi:hypothetical protein